MKSFLTPAFVWGLEENRFWCFCMRAKQELANIYTAAIGRFFVRSPPLCLSLPPPTPFWPISLSVCLIAAVCERVKPWCSCSSPGIPSPLPPLPPTCLSHRLSILTFSQTSLDLCVTRHCLSPSLIALPSRFRAATIVEICMRRAAKQRICLWL